MCASVYALLSGSLLAFGTGEELGLSSFLFGMLLVFAPPGAVRVVGAFEPLGTTVPYTLSPQRVQGGLWAPPPCGVKSSETCWVCVCLFVRFFWDGCLVIVPPRGKCCPLYIFCFLCLVRCFLPFFEILLFLGKIVFMSSLSFLGSCSP